MYTMHCIHTQREEINQSPCPNKCTPCFITVRKRGQEEKEGWPRRVQNKNDRHFLFPMMLYKRATSSAVCMLVITYLAATVRGDACRIPIKASSDGAS